MNLYDVFCSYYVVSEEHACTDASTDRKSLLGHSTVERARSVESHCIVATNQAFEVFLSTPATLQPATAPVHLDTPASVRVLGTRLFTRGQITTEA